MSENIFSLLLQYRNCCGHIMLSSSNTKYSQNLQHIRKFFKSIVSSSNQKSLNHSYQDMITWRDSLCSKQYLGCVDHSRTALSTIRQQWFCRRIWNGDINYPSVILDTSPCIKANKRRRRNNRFGDFIFKSTFLRHESLQGRRDIFKHKFSKYLAIGNSWDLIFVLRTESLGPQSKIPAIRKFSKIYA